MDNIDDPPRGIGPSVGPRIPEQGQPANEGAAPEPMLQFFEWAHLPPHLGMISARFGELAHSIVALLPRNPERTVALRKLLEAKDCAVRAALYRP